MAEATVTKSILKAILKLQDLEQAEIFIDLGLCIYQKVVMVALQASVIFWKSSASQCSDYSFLKL